VLKRMAKIVFFQKSQMIFRDILSGIDNDLNINV